MSSEVSPARAAALPFQKMVTPDTSTTCVRVPRTAHYGLEVAAFVCPFCRTLANFTVVWAGGQVPAAYRMVNAQLVALQCNNTDCLAAIVGVLVGMDVIVHWPESVGGKDFPDVPEHIAATANEAHMCQSIGAHRGAIALARAVVEATAKGHGVTSGDLYKKIDALAKNGVISESMREAAHEIRFAGNEVAHGDLSEQPFTAEDASEILALMDAILLRVYQEPAQVAGVRSRRQERLP